MGVKVPTVGRKRPNDVKLFHSNADAVDRPRPRRHSYLVLLLPATGWSLLRIQLDDQLFLRRDRNVRAGGTLEHPAAERLLVDGDPGKRRAA